MRILYSKKNEAGGSEEQKKCECEIRSQLLPKGTPGDEGSNTRVSGHSRKIRRVIDIDMKWVETPTGGLRAPGTGVKKDFSGRNRN